MRRRSFDIDAATMCSKAAFIRVVSGPSSTPTKMRAAMSSVSVL